MVHFITSEQIKEVLELEEQIQKLSHELYHQKSLLVMGRGYNFATCLEGALVCEHSPYFFSYKSLILVKSILGLISCFGNYLSSIFFI